MQKCKLKCNRNCNNLMMQIRLAKKCNAGIANLPAAKKMQLGQGIAKKNDATTKLQKTCDVTDKVQKKSDVTGKV